MADNNMVFLERFDRQRRRALDMDFSVTVERTHIEVTPGLLKAMDHSAKVPMRLDSVEELERFLDGVEWHKKYSKHLGFDERQAEKSWFDERERKRVYDTLSKE